MKINVVGEEHTEGTSKKTGKAYSLNIVYYTEAKTGVNGMIAERAALSAQDFEHPLKLCVKGKHPWARIAG